MENKKFKIGDRVRVIDHIRFFARDDYIGKTAKIICFGDSFDYGIEFDEKVNGHSCADRGKNGYCCYADERNLELIAPKNNKKIVITSDGVETLARLYEGNKVVKSATAKCSPDDEYSFETGAKIAFDRLIGNEEKSKYKAGDKVKVIANTCAHGANIGVVLTLDKKYTAYRHLTDAWDVKEAKNYYIVERDFEPYTEPEYFTGKVVCVESNVDFLTVGRIYDLSKHDGCGASDRGVPIIKTPPTDIEDLNRRIAGVKFIPLVE